MPQPSAINRAILGAVRAEHVTRTIVTQIEVDELGNARSAAQTNRLGRAIRRALPSPLYPAPPSAEELAPPSLERALPPALPEAATVRLPATPRPPREPRPPEEAAPRRAPPTELVPERSTLVFAGDSSGGGDASFGSKRIPWPCRVTRVTISTTGQSPAAAGQGNVTLHITKSAVELTTGTQITNADKLIDGRPHGDLVPDRQGAIQVPNMANISFEPGIDITAGGTFISVGSRTGASQIHVLVTIDLEQLSPTRRRTANRPNPEADPEPGDRRFNRPDPPAKRPPVIVPTVSTTPNLDDLWRRMQSEASFLRLFPDHFVTQLDAAGFPASPLQAITRRRLGAAPVTAAPQPPAGAAPPRVTATPRGPTIPPGTAGPPPPPAPTTRARNAAPEPEEVDECPDIQTLRNLFLRSIATGINADPGAQQRWAETPQRCKDKLRLGFGGIVRRPA